MSVAVLQRRAHLPQAFLHPSQPSSHFVNTSASDAGLWTAASFRTVSAKAIDARTKRLPAATGLPWFAILLVPWRRWLMTVVFAWQIGSTRTT